MSTVSVERPPPKQVDPKSEHAHQRPLDFGIIKRLFGYTTRYARLRNVLFVLVVLRSIQLPLVTWSIARVISGPITGRDAKGTVVAVLVFLAIEGMTELCFVYRMRCALWLGEAVVQDLRVEVYAHLLRLPMTFFKRTQVGRLIGRITSDVDVVRVGVQDVAFVCTVQGGSMVMSAGLMLWYDARLFLVVLAMAPILWMMLRYFRGRLSRATRAVQESFSRVTARLAESVHGIREIQGFVRQDINGGLFGQLVRDHSKFNMDLTRQSAAFQPLLEFNGQLFLAVLLVVGGYQVVSHRIGLEALIQFLFLSNTFFNGIPMIGNQYNQALTAMAGAERVFSLLDTEPEWQDADDAEDLGHVEGRVEIVDLGFEYVKDRPVLEHVSLTAEPGQAIALVGQTGSGKTTLVGIIAKLYLPTTGQLLIDGREIRAITGRSLHRQIGCVTQDNFLFSGSVLENIRTGRPDATDDEVREAARALDVLDLIESLPKGFDTVVGEKGAGVSVGQRQVICFVRAMLANPRILVLDEATSSIDAMTEARIQRALSRLLAGRTSFIIAHRLSTIRNADQVLVLDHGRVIERGKHAELVALGGKYAQMYRQFVNAGAAATTSPLPNVTSPPSATLTRPPE